MRTDLTPSEARAGDCITYVATVKQPGKKETQQEIRARVVERVGKILRVKTQVHKQLQPIAESQVMKAWREDRE